MRTDTDPIQTWQQALPLVGAAMHGPAGRRTRSVLIVSVCPHCQHLHLHWVTRPGCGTYIRRGSCGGWYRVVAAEFEVDGG